MPSDRPSKKQRELLSFIDGFIKGNGYGPSYREIMRALNYKSVSTVAVHIDGLISKGQLIKHGRSARSLEVVSDQTKPVTAVENDNIHINWLRQKIRDFESKGESPAANTIRNALEVLDQKEL